MRDNTVDRTLLLDFYGELLTDKQREYCDLHWNEDWSLAEIAERDGLSRQAAWDILRRAENSLRNFESKTGLVGRYLRRMEQIRQIHAELAQRLPEDAYKTQLLARIEELL